ncbi:hypothetical protein B0H19DRAFT_1265169 [Mycena capillaripes]|nr:hypothetical protein B0H19DRAFT_1265169 [Mycena capillaripes]
MQNVVSISSQLLPSSILRTTATIIVVLAAFIRIMKAMSLTRQTAVVAHQLSAVQHSFKTAITADPLRLVEPATAEDLARRLRGLEDAAERLRTETIGYAGSSIWWKRDLAVLHHTIEVARQAGKNRFNAEVAIVKSPLIRLYSAVRSVALLPFTVLAPSLHCFPPSLPLLPFHFVILPIHLASSPETVGHIRTGTLSLPGGVILNVATNDPQQPANALRMYTRSSRQAANTTVSLTAARLEFVTIRLRFVDGQIIVSDAGQELFLEHVGPSPPARIHFGWFVAWCRT